MDESILNAYEPGKIQIDSNIYNNVKVNSLTIVGEFGRGRYGSVTKRMLDDNLVAVKEIERMDRQKEKTTEYMDLKVMKHANSPFILKYYGCTFTIGFLYIFMEVMTMSLDQLKGRLQSENLKIPELILGKITVAVVEGLKYLEDELGIIHRDVKPSNILIHSNGEIKLCDFGISAKLNDPIAMGNSAGCCPYLSPERL